MDAAAPVGLIGFGSAGPAALTVFTDAAAADPHSRCAAVIIPAPGPRPRVRQPPAPIKAGGTQTLQRTPADPEGQGQCNS